MDLVGSNWIKLNQTGLNWIKLTWYWKVDKCGLDKHGLTNMVWQTWSDKHGLVKSCSWLTNIVLQIWSDKHGLDKHGLDKHGTDKHGLDKHRLGKHGLTFILKQSTLGLRLTLNLVWIESIAWLKIRSKLALYLHPRM